MIVGDLAGPVHRHASQEHRYAGLKSTDVGRDWVHVVEEHRVHL